MSAVSIVAYDSRNATHREAFRSLNLAWIERYFIVEAPDHHQLDDPEGHILAQGGLIFIAEEPAADRVQILGTCALIAGGDGTFELAKMAVRDDARGRGIGRALCVAAIDAARSRGAPSIALLSNTVLEPAIALYRSLGFRRVEMPTSEYSRANIMMVLDLGSAADGQGGG